MIDTRPPATSAPPVRGEDERERRLALMQRRATGLLVVMTGVFVALVLLTGDGGWQGYAKAAVEASLVGGLADWFAVTALFRHPLGVPIPHTAIIRERKDQFGRTLGDFVQENFLTPDVIIERLRGAHVTDRVRQWLSDRRNAEAIARHATELLVGAADVVKDEDVHRAVEEAFSRGVEALPVASLGGRALRLMTEQGRHQELLGAVLRGLERFLDDNHDALRDRFGQESPWWLPDAMEDRVFERLVDGVHNLLRSVAEDDEHEVRAQFDAWVDQFVDRLEHSPELQARGEELKRELLAHPELRAWSSSLWGEVKETLREQATRPDSELRQRMADVVLAAGERLHDDPALAAKLDELVESAVCYLAEHFHDEIGKLVTSTIERWDAEETSRKLELLLGPDLQFIRINGTVVGGLAGLAIHGIAQLLG